MAREIRTYLVDIVDILDACDLLGTFTHGRTLEDYLRDAMLRSAVERQFEIIGEAVRVATRHAPPGQEGEVFTNSSSSLNVAVARPTQLSAAP
jgi:uncharacterized protein with HEPN domain